MILSKGTHHKKVNLMFPPHRVYVSIISQNPGKKADTVGVELEEDGFILHAKVYSENAAFLWLVQNKI